MKGVKIGDGFDVVALRGGQENRDENRQRRFPEQPCGRRSQRVLSSGQQIIAISALKPTSSVPYRRIPLTALAKK
ncbi:hypothetical protein ACNKHV_14800 [Shigella flexneri]